MDINQKLQEAGLTGNESKVYLELLRKGELSANRIARNLGMDRTLVYTVLNHLIEKGQVGYVVKEGKKKFSTSEPENLLDSIRAKELLVGDLIKELKKIKKKDQQDVEVNVYEGKEGLRKFISMAMKYNNFCSFGATGRAFDFLYELPAIAKKWERKKKFKGRIITTPKFKSHGLMTKVKNIEFRYLDIKSESTTGIWGDNISIHLAVDKPIVVIIKNKEIAESYQNHFEVLWKVAKKI